MGHFPCFALLWLLLIQTRWDVRTYQRYLIPAILMISYSHDYSLAWTLISYERERYVFVHVFFLCDCGWSRVLSSFFRAGKVCFVFLCSKKNASGHRLVRLWPWLNTLEFGIGVTSKTSKHYIGTRHCYSRIIVSFTYYQEWKNEDIIASIDILN